MAGMAYNPKEALRPPADSGPYSGVDAHLPKLNTNRFAAADPHFYGNRASGAGGGVAEQRRAAQLRKNRQYAGVAFVVIMLGTAGYNIQNMPNCMQTVRGFCAYAFPPSIPTQEMCAFQACRAYEYTLQKNFDWSQYHRHDVKKIGEYPLPSPSSSSLPPADAAAWSPVQALSTLAAYISSFVSSAPPLAEQVGSDGRNIPIDMSIDPASAFDPAEFARMWQMQQMYGTLSELEGGGGDSGSDSDSGMSAAEAAYAAQATARMHTEAEWTQKGAGPRTGMAPAQKEAWTGYVDDSSGEPSLDYTCTVGCNLLKDMAAQRRCLSLCKTNFQ